MKKKIVIFGLIALILVTGLFVLTGCGDNNSKEGLYELVEVKDKSATFTAKELKDLTTMEYSLELKSDKTAVMTLKYKENMDGQDMTDTDYYTYDDEFFYGTNNEGTTEGKKYFKYELKDGKLYLSVIDNPNEEVHTYKKK